MTGSSKNGFARRKNGVSCMAKKSAAAKIRVALNKATGGGSKGGAHKPKGGSK